MDIYEKQNSVSSAVDKDFKSLIYDLPDDFELSDEFAMAFDTIENTNDCAFVTGKAGTGKSTLQKYFRANTKKKVVVLAPTGVSAVNINAQTIHSFFGLPWGLIQEEDVYTKEKYKDVLGATDTIIIDEISMVRVDVMQAIERILRLNAGNDKPFGGMQMVFFGDLFQLPPVVPEKELNKYFEQRYGGPFFFNADVFNKIKLKYIELTKVYRQTDADFIYILDKIRHKKITERELELLNHVLCNKSQPPHTNHCLTLTSTKQLADDINNFHLGRLNEKEYEYEATIQGVFNQDLYPTLYRIRLKKGAQVMMVKNDRNKRWVNGSVGVVEGLSSIHISVCIDNVTYDVPIEEWENFNYILNPKTGSIQKDVVGRFKQYPLRLSWATTVHKAQGHTLESVHIDLGNGAFCHGQCYVALSRCRTLNGISLAKPIRFDDIIFDKRIYKFLEKFS